MSRMLNLSNVLQLVIHSLYYSPLPEKQLSDTYINAPFMLLFSFVISCMPSTKSLSKRRLPMYPCQENLLDEHYQWDGNLTFQFNETVDYRLPLSRLGIIQTSLASALAAPSVVGYHLRKQMAHVLAYLFETELLQAAIP